MAKIDNLSSERIKKLRKILDLSQQDFSTAIKLHQSSLSTIENGGLPSVETIININKAYNIPSDWLLGFIEIADKELLELTKGLIKYEDLKSGIVMVQNGNNGGNNKQVVIEGDCEKENAHLREKLADKEQLLQEKDERIALLERLAGIKK